MDILSKLTLKEIELVEEKLRISDSTNKNYYNIIPKKTIDDLKRELNKEVWNKKNLKKCIEYTNSLDNSNNGSIGYISSSDGYDINKDICRSSLYLDKLVIDDPISISLFAPVLDEKEQSEYTYDCAQSIVNIKEWVEAGIATVCPISTKLWYDNINIKTMMTEHLSNNKEEGFEFILENTKFLDKYSDMGFSSQNIPFETMMEGIILEIEQLVYFSKLMGFVTTIKDYDQWEILNWRLKNGNHAKNDATANVLTLQKLNLRFLDTISTNLALDVREKGYGSDLRIYFREKFNEINNVTSESDFKSVVSNVSAEIDDEIRKYEKDMVNLGKSSLMRIAGGAALGIAGMAISASYGFPIENILIPTLVGIPKLGLDEFTKLKDKSNTSLSLLLDVKNQA
ncbi:hypothetical protein HNV12_25765 [Methanococcoides sp. SA1]|nr:hypothetical protein [Methanococcoides sp. SA1]